MAEEQPATMATRITDLDHDSFSHCASFLSLRDLSNLAMSSKSLKSFAYSDSIWLDRFREIWPENFPLSGVRKAYLNRRTALHQFKYYDPFVASLFAEGYYSVDNILLDKNDIIFSQGPAIKMAKIDSIMSGGSLVTMPGHNSRVTCLRLFPLSETSLAQSEAQTEENVLLTSNCDGSIRLWWKGACRRVFGGRHAAVHTMSDKLLGNGDVKVLASGEHDGSICLWSLSSSGRRYRQALKAKFCGDQKPVKWMSVAGNKPSNLVTMSGDSKVRVWDTTKLSDNRCVGLTSVRRKPVDMKCHENLLYVAADSSVVERWKPEPVTELYGRHQTPVTHLHMDPYKIITGGFKSNIVETWETDTGKKTISFFCSHPENRFNRGCSAMAVNACRIVAACHVGVRGFIHFTDFSSATRPL
ncbi:putative E3 ubiquitin ligase complex SCF subunit sconB [Gossypium australe]|uniref:Putative E3 ubiquitin ligase complex SCF subunit sconB n=1 Tax=Gossypium australe TaxID=47621 RepID=A0A5B6V6P8_9ROSI|nr:putative E3 ubiquitin ligase complex SCF subunit sconB [Gossypium australe]